MALIDWMNWIGQRRRLRAIGVPLHWAVMQLPLSTLIRIAGRRMVAASAGAPAVLLTHVGMEGALKDPRLLYEAMRFTVKDMGLDAVCLIADLSLEAEACGCQLQFSERALPMVMSHPLQGSDDPKLPKVPDPYHDGRMPVFLETMRLIKRNHSMIRVAVVTGPFTLATHLRGTEIYLDTVMNPELAKRILEYCTKVNIAYAGALIEAGADMIILAEPAGSQLSAAAYEEFSQAYSKRVIGALTRPCILHVCGKAGHIAEKMCESGAVGISVDDVDFPSLLRRAPRDIVVMGNIGTLTLLSSSPEEVATQTAELLRSARDRKEFVALPGCDLAPETPFENIRAFVRTAQACRP